MRRRRPPARARLPTPPSRRRRRRPSRLTRPRTPSGGGRAHALVPQCYCARPRVPWPARTCAAATLPPQPPQPTPCSRYKCRGARAWSGWARRGDRAYGTITDITIPHWNGRSSKGCRRWWEGSKRWWSKRRARDQLRPPRGSAYLLVYNCLTANTGRMCIYSYESLISKPS